MTQYVVQKDLEISDANDPLFGSHAPGSEIELDASLEATQTLIAEGVIAEKVAEGSGTVTGNESAPIPLGHFTLAVKWREGTTDEEKEAATPFIKEFTEALAESREDHVPLCIDEITVRRDR